MNDGRQRRRPNPQPSPTVIEANFVPSDLHERDDSESNFTSDSEAAAFSGEEDSTSPRSAASETEGYDTGSAHGLIGISYSDNDDDNSYASSVSAASSTSEVCEAFDVNSGEDDSDSASVYESGSRGDPTSSLPGDDDNEDDDVDDEDDDDDNEDDEDISRKVVGPYTMEECSTSPSFDDNDNGGSFSGSSQANDNKDGGDGSEECDVLQTFSLGSSSVLGETVAAESESGVMHPIEVQGLPPPLVITPTDLSELDACEEMAGEHAHFREEIVPSLSSSPRKQERGRRVKTEGKDGRRKVTRLGSMSISSGSAGDTPRGCGSFGGRLGERSTVVSRTSGSEVVFGSVPLTANQPSNVSPQNSSFVTCESDTESIVFSTESFHGPGSFFTEHIHSIESTSPPQVSAAPHVIPPPEIQAQQRTAQPVSSSTTTNTLPSTRRPYVRRYGLDAPTTSMPLPYPHPTSHLILSPAPGTLQDNMLSPFHRGHAIGGRGRSLNEWPATNRSSVSNRSSSGSYTSSNHTLAYSSESSGAAFKHNLNYSSESLGTLWSSPFQQSPSNNAATPRTKESPSAGQAHFQNWRPPALQTISGQSNTGTRNPTVLNSYSSATEGGGGGKFQNEDAFGDQQTIIRVEDTPTLSTTGPVAPLGHLRRHSEDLEQLLPPSEHHHHHKVSHQAHFGGQPPPCTRGRSVSEDLKVRPSHERQPSNLSFVSSASSSGSTGSEDLWSDVEVNIGEKVLSGKVDGEKDGGLSLSAFTTLSVPKPVMMRSESPPLHPSISLQRPNTLDPKSGRGSTSSLIHPSTNFQLALSANITPTTGLSALLSQDVDVYMRRESAGNVIKPVTGASYQLHHRMDSSGSSASQQHHRRLSSGNSFLGSISNPIMNLFSIVNNISPSSVESSSPGGSIEDVKVKYREKAQAFLNSSEILRARHQSNSPVLSIGGGTQHHSDGSPMRHSINAAVSSHITAPAGSRIGTASGSQIAGMSRPRRTIRSISPRPPSTRGSHRRGLASIDNDDWSVKVDEIEEKVQSVSKSAREVLKGKNKGKKTSSKKLQEGETSAVLHKEQKLHSYGAVRGRDHNRTNNRHEPPWKTNKFDSSTKSKQMRRKKNSASIDDEKQPLLDKIGRNGGNHPNKNEDDIRDRAKTSPVHSGYLLGRQVQHPKTPPGISSSEIREGKPSYHCTSNAGPGSIKGGSRKSRICWHSHKRSSHRQRGDPDLCGSKTEKELGQDCQGDGEKEGSSQLTRGKEKCILSGSKDADSTRHRIRKERCSANDSTSQRKSRKGDDLKIDDNSYRKKEKKRDLEKLKKEWKELTKLEKVEKKKHTKRRKRRSSNLRRGSKHELQKIKLSEDCIWSTSSSSSHFSDSPTQAKRRKERFERKKVKLIAKWTAEMAEEEARRRAELPSLGDIIRKTVSVYYQYYSDKWRRSRDMFEAMLSNLPFTICAIAMAIVTMGVVWFKFTEEMVDACVPVHFRLEACNFPEFPGCFECDFSNWKAFLAKYFHYSCSIVAGLLVSLFALKILVAHQVVLDELTNPTTSSPAGLLCMTIVCVFAGRGWVGQGLVFLASSCHLILAMGFIYTALAYRILPEPSWFPNTVGIGICAVKTWLYYPFVPFSHFLMATSVICQIIFFPISMIRVTADTNEKISAPVCWIQMSAPAVSLYALTIMAQPSSVTGQESNPSAFYSIHHKIYLPTMHFFFIMAVLGISSSIQSLRRRWKKFKYKDFSPAHAAFGFPVLAHANAVQAYRGAINSFGGIEFPPGCLFLKVIWIYWFIVLLFGTFLTIGQTALYLYHLKSWVLVDVEDEEEPPLPSETMIHEVIGTGGFDFNLPFMSTAVLQANETGALVRIAGGPYVRSRRVTALGFTPTLNWSELNKERNALLEFVAKNPPRKRVRTMSVPGVDFNYSFGGGHQGVWDGGALEAGRVGGVNRVRASTSDMNPSTGSWW